MLAPRALVETRFILTRFPPRNELVKPLLMVFLGCGIPVQMYYLVRSASQGVGATIFQRARTAGMVADAAPSPILAYFTLWALYAAPLFLIERRDRDFWLMTVIAFMASILSTGRLPILMLLSALVCVQLMVTRRQFVGPGRGGHGAGGEDLDVPFLQGDEVLTQQPQPMFDPSDHVLPVAGNHQSEPHSRARTTTR